MREKVRNVAVVIMSCVISLTSAAGYADVGDGPPPSYFIDESKLPFDALPGATAYWGVHTGAGFRIEVPDNWNGDLVLWAHGLRAFGELELTVDNHPLRQLLITLGYAWASSSFSRNEYDISTGVQDTHALLKRFSGLVGKPSRVYITGASMGGHIAAVLLEQYPHTFDGALSVCGALGDYELFDYYLDFNVAAQQLGTGASQFPVDPATYVGVTVPAIKASLEADTGGWPEFLNTTGTHLKDLTEQRSGGERPDFDAAWSFWNRYPEVSTGPGNFLFDLGLSDGSLPRAPGGGVDNTDAVYQFDSDPALTDDEQKLNDAVVRIAADPQTRHPNGLAQVPVISGDPDVPVLTLHNLGDLFVPVLNEIVYAQRVAEHGKSDLLVQRAIRGVQHCGFTPAEFSQAFLDLVGWVEGGIKPAGDNFLDPAQVADPDFGCRFTDFATPGGHLLATPCP